MGEVRLRFRGWSGSEECVPVCLLKKRGRKALLGVLPGRPKLVVRSK